MYKFVLFFYSPDTEQSDPLLYQIENFCKFPVQCIDVKNSARQGSFILTRINDDYMLYLPQDVTEFPTLTVYRGSNGAGAGGSMNVPYTCYTGKEVYTQLNIPLPTDDVLAAAHANAQAAMDPRYAPPGAAGGSGGYDPQGRMGQAGIVSSTSRFASAGRMTQEEMDARLKMFAEERAQYGGNAGNREGVDEQALARQQQKQARLMGQADAVPPGLTGPTSSALSGSAYQGSTAGPAQPRSMRPPPPHLPKAIRSQ